MRRYYCSELISGSFFFKRPPLTNWTLGMSPSEKKERKEGRKEGREERKKEREKERKSKRGKEREKERGRNRGKKGRQERRKANANSWVLSQIYWIRNSGGGANNLCSHTCSRWYRNMLTSGKCWPGRNAPCKQAPSQCPPSRHPHSLVQCLPYSSTS